MNYLAALKAMNNKRALLERSFVVVLFVLVMVVFSFAQRDTIEVFEKHNAKSTVQLPSPTPRFTAESPDADKQQKQLEN
jgi:hypothetical protein